MSMDCPKGCVVDAADSSRVASSDDLSVVKIEFERRAIQRKKDIWEFIESVFFFQPRPRAATMKWTPVSDKHKYAVAIANFFSQQDKPHRLQLTVGETVHILEENGDW